MLSSQKDVASRSTSEKFGKTYTKVDKVNGARETVCGDCQNVMVDTDDGVQCDHCDLWFHVKCSGLAQKTYAMLSKIDNFDWTCQKCKKELTNFRKENRQLKQENDSLKLENQNLKDRLTAMEKRLVTRGDKGRVEGRYSY